MNPHANSLYIRACYRESVERAPVWMMRQAGRYLPEYRALRAKHSFTTMYKTPELAAEVTLQPIDRLSVDAAIIFSDILVIPEAMGMELEFLEGKGPVFSQPIRDAADLEKLVIPSAEEKLPFVLKAIEIVSQELKDKVPVIGFCGAPWTVAAYMIEGMGSKNFGKLKKWRFAEPELLHKLLDKVTEASIDYCRQQIQHGAAAIQIFDTWAGILDTSGFREFALAYVEKLITGIHKAGIPTIYFPKGAGQWLDIVSEINADVIGLDWTVSPILAKQKLPNERFALQGNLDPTALYAPKDKIREMVIHMLSQFPCKKGYIANLGHGILPDIPVEHALEFIQAVQEESAKQPPITA